MVLITMTNCKDRSSRRTTSNVISNQSTSDRVIVNWSLVLVCHAVLRALVNWLLLWCRRIYLSWRGVATLGWPLFAALSCSRRSLWQEIYLKQMWLTVIGWNCGHRLQSVEMRLKAQNDKNTGSLYRYWMPDKCHHFVLNR
jgi:hypothetical protein